MPFQPRSVAFRLFKHRRCISSLFNPLFFFFGKLQANQFIYNNTQFTIPFDFDCLQSGPTVAAQSRGVLVAGTDTGLGGPGCCWVLIVYEFAGWFTLLMFYMAQSDLFFILDDS